MLKFAANLTMLFNEMPFLDRFAAAAEAGFKGVEFLFPYAFEKQQLVETVRKTGLIVALHNLPAGNWEAGERGIACNPDRVSEFRAGVERAIEYATALGCRQVNCLAGIPPTDIDAGQARDTFIENLRHAAPRLKDAGILLLIEPVNTRDIPGFFLNHTKQALDIIDEVGSDNLKLQHDIYHMQVMEGNLLPTIEANLPRIAHMQVADNPKRNEPGTGEINYRFLFREIERLGYDGWIGCEYKPAGDTKAGLGWLRSIAA
ncbi:MAG TPA: hydroxypyruvate isomerase [Acetobacteraceae bacterium]|nr:hydroxypyruvate isomerase [Acetobacteraceae bacterium]